MQQKKNNNVRLCDIAAECGVSVVTVAKVLNAQNKGDARVGAQTAERVMAVALKLNYRPNLTARNLRSGSSRIIGVLIDSHMIGPLDRLLVAIEQCAAEAGYRIMIGEEHENISNIVACYQNFRQYGAEGVICISHDYPNTGDSVYDFLAQQPRLVFIGKPKLANAIYVNVANEEQTVPGLDFLWENGRRHIAFLITGDGYMALEGIRAGFLRRIEELGGQRNENGRIVLLPSVSGPIPNMRGNIVNWIDRELPQWPCDGVITMCDGYAGIIMQEFSKRNVHVPEEIAVIGHGNDIFCEYLNPPLASIDDNLAVQGRVAVNLIFAMNKNTEDDYSALPSHAAIHPNFIWRESAGGCPVSDQNNKGS